MLDYVAHLVEVVDDVHIPPQIIHNFLIGVFVISGILIEGDIREKYWIISAHSRFSFHFLKVEY